MSQTQADALADSLRAASEAGQRQATIAFRSEGNIRNQPHPQLRSALTLAPTIGLRGEGQADRTGRAATTTTIYCREERQNFKNA